MAKKTTKEMETIGAIATANKITGTFGVVESDLKLIMSQTEDVEAGKDMILFCMQQIAKQHDIELCAKETIIKEIVKEEKVTVVEEVKVEEPKKEEPKKEVKKDNKKKLAKLNTTQAFISMAESFEDEYETIEVDEKLIQAYTNKDTKVQETNGILHYTKNVGFENEEVIMCIPLHGRHYVAVHPVGSGIVCPSLPYSISGEDKIQMLIDELTNIAKDNNLLTETVEGNYLAPIITTYGYGLFKTGSEQFYGSIGGFDYKYEGGKSSIGIRSAHQTFHNASVYSRATAVALHEKAKLKPDAKIKITDEHMDSLNTMYDDGMGIVKTITELYNERNNMLKASGEIHIEGKGLTKEQQASLDAHMNAGNIEDIEGIC